MKLYVISANTYDGVWGSEINIFGVFDEEHLESALKGLQEKYGHYFGINEVSLNECKAIYLGGYYE